MTSNDSDAEVLVERADGVLKVTLNRPERLNALVPGMMARLAAVMLSAAEDPSVGCVVLTGAGRGFCAGGDLEQGKIPALPAALEIGGPVEQGYTRLRSFMEASRLLHEMPKPTIAMLNGPVAGAGIGLAGACDLRFAATSAAFVSAFSRVGASGDFGSSWFWTKILGSAAARELFFLEEKLSAQQALAKGIYTRVFADDALYEETLTVARRLANGPRMAWRYMKANLNLAEDGHFEAALDHEALNMGLSARASALTRRSHANKDAPDGLPSSSPGAG